MQGFRWIDPAAAPEAFRKNGHLTVPFHNMVGLIDPAKGQQAIVGYSPDDANAFASPRVSPDGTRLILVAGTLSEGGLKPRTLLTMPLRPNAFPQASPLVQGEVYEPSWSTDGKRIVYAKRVSGKRDLFTIGADGTGETSLTQGKGDFATPLFSPAAGK